MTARTVDDFHSGHIAVKVINEPNGHYLCEATPSVEGLSAPTARSYGESPKHAIAIALEQLARGFRLQAEAEQNIDWDAVDQSPTGEIKSKRFHVILHYERVADERTRFDALVNTQMGNTVVENAEVTLIQIGPDLQVATARRRHDRG